MRIEEPSGWLETSSTSTLTLTPSPPTPVHVAHAPCGVTNTHRVFHVPSKRYLLRDDHHVERVWDERGAELLEDMVLGPPVDEKEARAIQEEAGFAAFTAKQTEQDRNAALLDALRTDIRRDTHDLSQLQWQLQGVRLRRELVSGLRRMLVGGGDEMVVDALMGWAFPGFKKGAGGEADAEGEDWNEEGGEEESIDGDEEEE
ncbi:hypothetical protein P171DRAFT_439603 [Karstenula rhodostoma CBS 690.94]|uniref:Uncharacterized protein n=1 Tax=Karstenula rhodostoma CBS 690.94 TaxID=1392251 RepID=A0A9P4PYA8_9PLEO|nr:hypothetical protein P171DRAFT_439603 [Karstenula rhodostoma CBS 690.94]